MKNNEKMSFVTAFLFLLTAFSSLFIPIVKLSAYAEVVGLTVGAKSTISLPQWIKIDFSGDSAIEFYQALAQTGKTEGTLMLSVVLPVLVLLSLIATGIIVVWINGKFRSIVGLVSSVLYETLISVKFFEIRNIAKGAAADADISILSDGEPVVEVHFGLFILLILGILCLASCVLLLYLDYNKNSVLHSTESFVPDNRETIFEIHGISGMYNGAVFKVEPGESVILGRDPSMCQIVINETNQEISRKHCLVSCDLDGEGFKIIDYSSLGTYVNGQRIDSGIVYPLPFGARFWLGNEENTFSVCRNYKK